MMMKWWGLRVLEEWRSGGVGWSRREQQMVVVASGTSNEERAAGSEQRASHSKTHFTITTTSASLHIPPYPLCHL